MHLYPISFIEQKSVIHNKPPLLSSTLPFQTDQLDRHFIQSQTVCSGHKGAAGRWELFLSLSNFYLRKICWLQKWANLLHVSLKRYKQSKNCPIILYSCYIGKKKKNKWEEQSVRKEKRNLGGNVHSDLCLPHFLKTVAQLSLWDNCFKRSQICFIWLEFM